MTLLDGIVFAILVLRFAVFWVNVFGVLAYFSAGFPQTQENTKNVVNAGAGAWNFVYDVLILAWVYSHLFPPVVTGGEP